MVAAAFSFTKKVNKSHLRRLQEPFSCSIITYIKEQSGKEEIILKQFIKKHFEIACVLISLGLLGISSLFSWDGNPVMGFDKMSADIIICLICAFFIAKLGLWKSAGFHKHGFWKGILYGSPFLLLGAGSVLVSNVGVDLSSLQFISLSNAVLFAVNMFLVGLNEELWMRGLVLNGLLSKYGESNESVWKAIGVSSLIFGAIHIPNLFFMNPLTLLVQVLNAAAGGVLFGAVYVKSNNIWSGIVIHALVDWCSLFIDHCYENTTSVLSMQMSIPQASLIVLAGSGIPVLIAYFLLREKTIKAR